MDLSELSSVTISQANRLFLNLFEKQDRRSWTTSRPKVSGPFGESKRPWRAKDVRPSLSDGWTSIRGTMRLQTIGVVWSPGRFGTRENLESLPRLHHSSVSVQYSAWLLRIYQENLVTSVTGAIPTAHWFRRLPSRGRTFVPPWKRRGQRTSNCSRSTVIRA